LGIAALLETTAITQTPTTRHATCEPMTWALPLRHIRSTVDKSPIIFGTITYHRDGIYAGWLHWTDPHISTDRQRAYAADAPDRDGDNSPGQERVIAQRS
jgi:hypothetical protein